MSMDKETLHFDPQPGMRERQLQRRHLNPSFGVAAAVTPAELTEAQRGDAAERGEFYRNFQETLGEIAAFSGQVDSEKVLAAKQRVDQQYEQCRGLCGDNEKALAGLLRLQEMIMQAIRQGAGDDPTALKELGEEAAARQLHQQLLQHAIVGDLLRPDSVISENDLVPSLLSEPGAAVEAATNLFTPPQLDELVQKGERLLKELDDQATDVAREALDILRRHLAH